jgi:very-short-patch-repair endonuclease
MATWAARRKVVHRMGAEYSSRSETDPDRLIAELARRQHGLLSTAQLLKIGVSRRMIARRVERHQLHAIHRGVLSIVPRELMSARAFFMAAVLAGGDGAVLSHRSAAALWGIRPSAAPVVDITVPRRTGTRRGIRAHHVILPPDECTILDHIPVTSPARTLFDLAAGLRRQELTRSIEQTEVLRLWSPTSLAQLLERHPGRRGATTVRAVLAAGEAWARVTRSELEKRFLSLLERAGLPLPQSNGRVGDYEADCLWREQQVIVELDGGGVHDTTAAFERDRERDRRLAVAGWTTLRVTWRQLHDDPRAVAADLEAVLTTTPRAPPSPRSPQPAPHLLAARL